MNILVTGCAGFIGFHLTLNLLKNKKYRIVGIDNLNNYYDQKLKIDRLTILKKKNLLFHKINLTNKSKLDKIFKKFKFSIIINLAAQAGVRNSITNPKSYFKSNLEGFFNIIEFSRRYNIKHLLSASSSSVYGDTNSFPLSESMDTEKPLSFYAATKKSNEIMAYSYSNIYKIPVTMMRFFTVYGEYGRPDMALFKFTKAIMEDKNIDLYNHGKHFRDFTYVKDTVNGVVGLIDNPPQTKIPYRVINIARGKEESLIAYLKLIEKFLNKEAVVNNLPIQKGDVIKTLSSIKKLKKLTNYNPKIGIKEGVKLFIQWYRKYYKC